MTNKYFNEVESRIMEMIDRMKGLCASYGLSNQSAEEEIITQVFLYKFLNDQFVHNLYRYIDEHNLTLEEILDTENNDYLYEFYDSHASNIRFNWEDTIQGLVNKTSQENFCSLLDDAFERISANPKNKKFNIQSENGEEIKLFTRICNKVDSFTRNAFAVSLFGIISESKFDFSDAFVGNFDFYGTIFEYLIKDYNVASGKYAEYYTPQFAAKIIARILVGMSNIEPGKLYRIYDPSAGSGCLILHLAQELQRYGCRVRIYAQDISAKSNRFLKINMLLNGLSESIKNIRKGDTLLNPAHFVDADDVNSALLRFHFTTSNPPFKMDFSEVVNAIMQKWAETERFFAGLPKIPNKKKESMAIYTSFIQAILYTLEADGKTAIVVPTGFLTAQSGIEYRIRQYLIKENILAGVVSMPSNIFANTRTNVSILFIDKSRKSLEEEQPIIFIDASNLGKKEKVGKNERTVLSEEEENYIIDTFINREQIEDFSVVVSNNDIKEKNYSFSAGQYFEVKIDYVDITQEEYNKMIEDFNSDFATYVAETLAFQASIKEQLEGLSVNGEN